MAANLITTLQNAIISYGQQQGVHSKVDALLQAAFAELSRWLERDGKVRISADQGLSINGEPLDTDALDKAFVTAFFNYMAAATLTEITLDKGLSMRECIVFVALMARPPESFPGPQDIGRTLRLKGVRHISFAFKQPSVAAEPGKKKKAEVIVTQDVEDYSQDEDTSEELFSTEEKTTFHTPRPAPAKIKVTADLSLVKRMESIIRHLGDGFEQHTAKRNILRNMIQSLTPESILDILLSYGQSEQGRAKNTRYIFPYITENKLAQLAGHAIMIADDELYKRREKANMALVRSLQELLSRLYTPSLPGEIKAKLRVVDLLVLYYENPKASICQESGLLKGRISSQELAHMLYAIFMELDIMGHRDIFKQMNREFFTLLQGSADKQVAEGFRRILHNVLSLLFARNPRGFASTFKQLLSAVETATERDNLYDFAADMSAAFAPKLVKKGDFALVRAVLRVFSMHRNTKETRDAAQWYKARVTINAIAQSQAIKDYIASFHWLNEKKRSELLLTLLFIKESAVKYLLQLLAESAELKSRKSLIAAVVSVGKDAVPFVAAELAMDKPWYYLRNLVLILGEIGARETAGIVKNFLYHPDKRVRKEAINALIHFGDPPAFGHLVDYLNTQAERDPYTIKKIITSFKDADSKLVAPLLLRALNEEIFTEVESEDHDIKQACCYVVGRLHIKEAAQVLKKIVHKKSLFSISKGYSDSLRAAAVYALYHIGALTDIASYLKDESPMVRSVVNEIIKSQ